MSQKEGENMRQYVTHLKGAANLCNFKVSSGTETVSYADQMVLDRLVTSLRDQQITKETLRRWPPRDSEPTSYNSHKHQAGKSQQCKLRVRPDEKTFTHMEFSNSELRSTRPASHPSITLSATVNSGFYDKLNVRVPKAAVRTAQAKLTPMCDTGTMMCIMGRSMLNELKINKSELVKVTE